MVTALDDVVGNMVQKLKDVGMYNNTVIVFSSDNGPDPRFNLLGARPLKGIVV